MDQNLLERVNPVFNTAKMTVFQLAAAGVGDAASVAEKLNLSFEETQNSATTTVAPEQMTANMILVETRWRTCAAIAEETGCKTLVDLPCGYTPRAKAMAQKATEIASEEKDLDVFFETLLRTGDETLAYTPELLPVLRRYSRR